jgi:hypothetical protein
MIPMHPVAGPDPQTLRWVVQRTSHEQLVGAAAAAPIAALVADGTLLAVRAVPEGFVTTLTAGRSWPVDGSRVRRALHAAVDAQQVQCQAGSCSGCPASTVDIRSA